MSVLTENTVTRWRSVIKNSRKAARHGLFLNSKLLMLHFEWRSWLFLRWRIFSPLQAKCTYALLCKTRVHDEPFFLESIVTDLHYHRWGKHSVHEYAAESIMQKGRIKKALNGAQCRLYKMAAKWKQQEICDSVSDEMNPEETGGWLLFFNEAMSTSRHTRPLKQQILT